MSLKHALFELKEVLSNQNNEPLHEELVFELESKNGLSSGTLVYYYNHLFMFYRNNSDSKGKSIEEAKKINRRWTKNEIEFMFQYMKDRQAEGCINITEILDEISQLLGRGYQSVSYKYYSTMKAKEINDETNQKNLRFATIPQNDVPVVSTEVIESYPQVTSLNQVIVPQNDNLLDILSGLITNVQQLSGINLNAMLGSLNQLTSMALENQLLVQKLEMIKSENQQEKEALKLKLLKKEQQLALEKQRNDDLQLEMSKLAKEITAFNQLGDSAKIQNLKMYNQRLNYIIDQFGLVLKIGS